MTGNSLITTHVLDIAAGRPAAGIAVVLERMETDGQWRKIADGATNEDGRLSDWPVPGPLAQTRYRITFAVGDYFKQRSVTTFYPQVVVEFQTSLPDERYHVPLLLSPFGYSTYRGS